MEPMDDYTLSHLTWSAQVAVSLYEFTKRGQQPTAEDIQQDLEKRLKEPIPISHVTGQLEAEEEANHVKMHQDGTYSLPNYVKELLEGSIIGMRIITDEERYRSGIIEDLASASQPMSDEEFEKLFGEGLE